MAAKKEYFEGVEVTGTLDDGFADRAESANIGSVADKRSLVTNIKGDIFEAIAHMIMIFVINGNTEKFSGTGFLCDLEGELWFLTAAHNVKIVNKYINVFADKVKIYFGRNGMKGKLWSEIEVSGQDFEVEEDFKESISEHDFAKLRILDHVGRRKIPTTVFHVPSEAADIQYSRLIVSGYPGFPEDKDRRKDGVPGYPMYTLWTVSCNAGAYRSYEHIQYRDSTSVGNSGSPLHFKGDDGKHYAAGVHVGFVAIIKANCGVIITRCFKGHKKNTAAKSDDPVSVKLEEMTINEKKTDKVEAGNIGTVLKIFKGEKCSGKVKFPLSVKATHCTDVHSGQFVTTSGTSACCWSLKGEKLWENEDEKDGRFVSICYVPEKERILFSVLSNRKYTMKFLSLAGKMLDNFGASVVAPFAITSGGGFIYVTCLDDRKLHVLDLQGNEVRSFETQLSNPTYLTWLPRSDTLVISDWGMNMIKAFGTFGELKWQYGGQGNGVGQLSMPQGMCVAPDGATLLVADCVNCRIVMISEEGKHLQDLLTLADGVKQPKDVALMKSGELVVLDHTKSTMYNIDW